MYKIKLYNISNKLENKLICPMILDRQHGKMLIQRKEK